MDYGDYLAGILRERIAERLEKDTDNDRKDERALNDDSTAGEFPENWPPRPGDTWEADGTTWHAFCPRLDVIRLESPGTFLAYASDAGAGQRAHVNQRGCLEEFAKLNPVLKYREPAVTGNSKPDPRLEIVARVLNKELSGKDKDGYIREVSGEILAALDTADRKAKGNYIPELAQLRGIERALRDALTRAVNDLSRAEQALAVMENAAAGPPARACRDNLRLRAGSLLASGTQVAALMKDFQHAAKEITQ